MLLSTSRLFQSLHQTRLLPIRAPPANNLPPPPPRQTSEACARSTPASPSTRPNSPLNPIKLLQVVSRAELDRFRSMSRAASHARFHLFQSVPLSSPDGWRAAWTEKSDWYLRTMSSTLTERSMRTEGATPPPPSLSPRYSLEWASSEQGDRSEGARRAHSTSLFHNRT